MSPAGPIAVYALTAPAAGRARELARHMPGARVCLPRRLAGEGEFAFDRLATALAADWGVYSGLVVFAAAGIVVRAVAGLLRDKKSDPALVVCDPQGRYAVSLLSGHLGGANDLAREVARVLGGQAVITTATDAAGLPSLEVVAADAGLAWDDLTPLAAISRGLVEGGAVPIWDPAGWLRPALANWPERFPALAADPGGELAERPLILVSHQAGEYPAPWLVLRPPALAVGVGCNRDTPAEAIERFIAEVLAGHGLAPASLARLASVDIKQDEEGLIAAAQDLGLPLIFYPRDELDRVDAPHPSEAVRRHLGIGSVCEAAAILAAGGGELMVTKQKTPDVTVAVALCRPAS